MSFISKNVILGPPIKLSSWRKIAMGTWRDAGDPSVYGVLELDAAPALAHIEKIKQTTGTRVTVSHFVGRVVAESLRRNPQINCILRWGRLYPRTNVDVFFQVATDAQGQDLSGMVIRDADKKSIHQIAVEMDQKVQKIKAKKDPSFQKMKNTMGMIPGFFTHMILTLSGFLLYTLNLWTPAIGSPKDPFGSAMITNIGSLGLSEAFAPLVPYSRIPLLIAVGAVHEVPVVENGQVVVGKRIKLCATFDHRLIDGVHASHMSKTVKELFANPQSLD